MFGLKERVCQSCGMPLSKDPQGGGTDTNGVISKEYCSKYYQNGKFTHPNITASEMLELVKGNLKEMGFPGFIAACSRRMRLN